MYYIEKPKQVFSYTLYEETHYDTSNAYFSELGLSKEDIEVIKKAEIKFYNQLEYFEKKWANKILELTDFMMIEDATYNDLTIRESFMFEEIKDYRKKLRDYKDKTRIEDRPMRPSWLVI